MTQQRRFRKQFEDEAVHLVRTNGKPSGRPRRILVLGSRRWSSGAPTFIATATLMLNSPEQS
jgi:hypothetical protein